jgi:hypothetical protein
MLEVGEIQPDDEEIYGVGHGETVDPGRKPGQGHVSSSTF